MHAWQGCSECCRMIELQNDSLCWMIVEPLPKCWANYISLSSILSRVMFNHLSRYYTLYPCHLIQSYIANLHHRWYSDWLPVKGRSALSSYTLGKDDVCLKYSLLTLLSSAIVLVLWCVLSSATTKQFVKLPNCSSACDQKTLWKFTAKTRVSASALSG